jgi:hypothetical protein
MDRKVKETIYNEIHNKGEIDQDHIVGLLKIYDDKPNLNKLVESYYKSKANRIISSFKDDNHVRDCFAVKEGNKTTYVNISTTNKVYYVKDIAGSLKKQIDGRKKSMKKANSRVKILEGQVKIEDIENEEIAQ